MLFVHQEKTTDFNRRFYDRVEDLQIFNCGDINILKIILDGIRTDRELMKADIGFFFHKEWLYRFILLMMRIKRFLFRRKMLESYNEQLIMLQSLANRKFMVIDDHRVTETQDGRKVSFYFENIINSFGRDNVIYMYAGIMPAEQHFDFRYIDHLHYTLANRLTGDDRKFRKNLLDTFQRVKRSGKFTNVELKRIKTAIVLFFSSFRAWNSILAHIRPERAVLIRTYYTEGLLLALKRHNIQSVELQHGLFSLDDIDYVFPSKIKKIKDRAFFPDKMLTFGPFWKNLLMMGFEFTEDQLDTIGYYPYVNDQAKYQLSKQLKPFVKNNGILLVATQFFLEKEYCDYVRWLSRDLLQKKQPYVIIVKLHPGDNPDLYQSLNSLENVKIVTGNINDYLSISDALISIFSTTLYDAIRYDVPSFALYKKTFSGYIDEMAKWGVVHKLKMNESPVNYLNKNTLKRDVPYFYSPPNYQVLKSELISSEAYIKQLMTQGES